MSKITNNSQGPNRNSNDKLTWNQTEVDLNTKKRSALSEEIVFGFGQTTRGRQQIVLQTQYSQNFILEIFIRNIQSDLG